ncbi:MAG TPA: T9SS type A sorting domain-containing protein [Bacteroidales bacterium]|nr:T9SS type A sorting domain-containing protein [Bacteroidales bacterium]
MNRYIIIYLIVFLLGAKSLSSQIVADTFYIPNYPVPEIYYTDDAPELPENVWNHKLEYFPPWRYDQFQLPNCGQASAVYYCLSYEFNRALDRAADSSTIFAPTFSYNFQSEGEGWFGVSSFNSWNLVKSQGNPSIKVFNDICPNDSTCLSNEYRGKYWMSGYDNYYSSFQYRISDYYSLNVSTDEDLKILMHYFDDHLKGESSGGTVIFYSNAYFMYTGETPVLTDSDLCYPNNKVKVISFISGRPTHSMTIVGYYYNTTIDFNGDGLITDTIDINNDHIVDRHDNEKTLWIVINSYGDAWNYSMFLFKYDLPEKFWNKQVFIPVPDLEYKTELCFKIKLKHTWRNSLKISAGISTDLESDIPEKIIDFPVFNFQGGHHVMTGLDTVTGADVMEFGIDVTDILKHYELAGDSKIFLIIDNSGGIEGELQYFSVMQYSDGSVNEFVGVDSDVELPPASVSVFPIELFLVSYPKDTVLSFDVSDYNVAIAGEELDIKLHAGGGNPPYTFHILKTDEYIQEYCSEEFFQPDNLDFYRDTLRAICPGWKFPCAGELWDSIYIGLDATISFNGNNKAANELYPYPEIRTSLYNDIQLSVFNSYYLQEPVLYSYQINDTCFDIWFNDSLSTVFKCRATIYQDGRIKMTYDNMGNYYNRTAGLKTYTGIYYCGLASTTVPSYNNTVIYEPIQGFSSMYVTDDNYLKVTNTQEAGEKEVYIQLDDAGGGKVVKRVQYEIIASENIGNLYPNPFTDNAYFDITTKYDLMCSIKIYNTSGQLVSKMNEYLLPGKNTITISAQSLNLNSGFYICVVDAEKFSRKYRIVIL